MFQLLKMFTQSVNHPKFRSLKHTTKQKLAYELKSKKFQLKIPTELSTLTDLTVAIGWDNFLAGA